jgi:hypothetical protein
VACSIHIFTSEQLLALCKFLVDGNLTPPPNHYCIRILQIVPGLDQDLSTVVLNIPELLRHGDFWLIFAGGDAGLQHNAPVGLRHLCLFASSFSGWTTSHTSRGSEESAALPRQPCRHKTEAMLPNDQGAQSGHAYMRDLGAS